MPSRRCRCRRGITRNVLPTAAPAIVRAKACVTMATCGRDWRSRSVKGRPSMMRKPTDSQRAPPASRLRLRVLHSVGRSDSGATVIVRVEAEGSDVVVRVEDGGDGIDAGFCLFCSTHSNKAQEDRGRMAASGLDCTSRSDLSSVTVARSTPAATVPGVGRCSRYDFRARTPLCSRSRGDAGFTDPADCSQDFTRGSCRPNQRAFRF